MLAVARIRTRASSLPRVSLPSSPKLKRTLLVALALAAALFAGYMLWFRDSSFVAVEQVSISGASSRPDIEAALEGAAREQTTLNVDQAALSESVSGDPAVRGIVATPDFPHGLAIEVDLRQPVAWLEAGGAVLAGDGVVLDSAGKAPESIPVVQLGSAETATGGAGLERAVGDAMVLAEVMGTAPAPLVPEVASIGFDKQYGIVAELRGGIELRFGVQRGSELKWKAAAAVLADPELEGVEYLDLSVPDRPVAGGLPPDAVDEPVTEEPAPVEPAGTVTEETAPVEAAAEPAVDPVTGAPVTP